jgi:hypothetical protein
MFTARYELDLYLSFRLIFVFRCYKLVFELQGKCLAGSLIVLCQNKILEFHINMCT